MYACRYLNIVTYELFSSTLKINKTFLNTVRSYACTYTLIVYNKRMFIFASYGLKSCRSSFKALLDVPF